MAIHYEKEMETSGGFQKVIEESAMGMILQNLQNYQYQYPVKSTIRELVSNAVDATKEKFQAIAILKGEAKEEDFYIRRDEAMYKDSNFDRAYFNPSHLSGQTHVDIIYEEGDAVSKDRVRIIDQGVGLGGKRLDGYFKLGWSSKRNSKAALGKFGIGAKAALSTGVDYYTVISRYNGQQFTFNVYSHKVDSIVSPIDSTTGKKREYYVMYEGTPNEYKAYWEPTTLPNGTEVIVETKKHKKQEFLDAVKSQLLYFDNVTLTVKRADGYTVQIPVRANVLFENEYLIVSDNKLYSKPHLVVNKVNYGYIDFQELELEQKLGNVGIRVSAEEIDVNPSRESVIWSELTKITIQTRFKQAANVATGLLQEKLKVNDLFQWLRTWASVKNSYKNGTDVIARLAGIVDLDDLEPAFPLDSTLKVSENTALLFPGIQFQRIQKEEVTKGGKKIRTLKRDDVWLRDMNSNTTIYITDEKPKLTTLRYLATVYPQGYYLVRYPKDLDQVTKADDEDSDFIEAFEVRPLAEKVLEKGLKDTEIRKKDTLPEAIQKLVDRRKRVIALAKSSSVVTPLGSVGVPDDFSWVEEEGEESDDVENDATKSISPEERRRLEQRIVAFTPRGHDFIPNPPFWVNDPKGGPGRQFDKTIDKVRLYEWQKVEPKLAKVQSLTGDEIYYGTSKDEEMLHFAAALTSPGRKTFYGNPYTQSEISDPVFKDEWGLEKTIVQSTPHIANWGPRAEVTLLKVARDQVKHYTAYKHITEFFARVENDTITMSTTLVQWHTARIVSEKLGSLAFLQNYRIFDKDVADKYQKLRKYVEDHYRSIKETIKDGYFFSMEGEAYEQLLEFQEKVMQLQLLTREVSAKESEDVAAATIASASKSLFGTEYSGGIGIELEVWDSLQELLEYAEPIATLFNQMPLLTAPENNNISAEVEAEIRSYLAYKGL